MSFATFTALIYIHMQMQIVDLAYKGKDKQKLFYELMDNNGTLTHQVLALKSANHLGQELLGKDDGLQFIGHEQVLSVPASAFAHTIERSKMKAENPRWNWLTFLSPQEAKAWDH